MISTNIFSQLFLRASCIKKQFRIINKILTSPQPQCIRQNHLQPCRRLPQDKVLSEFASVTYYYEKSIPVTVISTRLGTKLVLYKQDQKEKLDQKTPPKSPPHKKETVNYGPSKTSKNNKTGKPSLEQLNQVYLNLCNNVPFFFTRPHDYSIYHKDLVFDNNIRNVQTRGLPAYVQHLAMLKIMCHIKYAHVSMEVLRITEHPEDGTVRVRWRVVGVPGLRALLLFWRQPVWDLTRFIDRNSEWIDGFSVFTVGEDGLVHHHVCDKMIPDSEPLPKTREANMAEAVKLALLLGPLTSLPPP